jgi:hypothetical protein
MHAVLNRAAQNIELSSRVDALREKHTRTRSLNDLNVLVVTIEKLASALTEENEKYPAVYSNWGTAFHTWDI